MNVACFKFYIPANALRIGACQSLINTRCTFVANCRKRQIQLIVADRLLFERCWLTIGDRAQRRTLIGCGLQFALGLGERFLRPREITERLFNEVPRADFSFRVYPRRNHGVRKLDNRHEADVRLILAARSLRQMPMSQLSHKIRRPRSLTRKTSHRYLIIRYMGWSSQGRRIQFSDLNLINLDSTRRICQEKKMS